MTSSLYRKGDPLPGWPAGRGEGAIFSWSVGGAQLLIGIEPRPGDEKAFRKAALTAGLLWKPPTIAMGWR